MDLKIIHVQNHGDLANEHISLSAVKSLNIWEYILSDSTFHDDGTLSNKHRHVYDFDALPAISLNAGDIVLLFTKKGRYQVTDVPNGAKAHIVYWGLENTVWNKDGDTAILVKVAERTKTSV